MINNTPEDIILKELNDLKQENEKLKIELEAFKLTQGKTLSIEQYFTQKYLERYTQILNNRIKSIDKDINELQQEYDNLSIEVANLSDIVMMNEQYQAELKKLEDIKNANVVKLNELKSLFDSTNTQYLTKQNILKNATLGYYRTILNSMENNNDLSLVMTNVEFVMQQLQDQLYLLILECRALGFQVNSLQEKLDDLESIIFEENKVIEKTTNELLAKIKTRTNEEIGNMQENIKVEISQRENLRKELLETFEFIKQQDIKDILDTVNFNRIKELSSSQISEIVESLVNERCEKLLSQDTFKNLRALKQMELSALIKEKEQLLSQKKRYDFLNEKQDKYFSTYVEASRYYDELVEFLDNATLAISENAYYSIASKKYNELKLTEKEIEAQYDIISDKLETVKKEHSEKSLSGIKETEIKELSHKLSELNAEKNRISGLLREARDAIRVFNQDPNNIKLVSVLREKEFVEAKLSTMYNNLRDLKVKISKIKEEIKDLQIALKDYDSICERIGILENELNN